MKYFVVAVWKVVLLNVSDRPAAEDGQIKDFIFPRVDDAIGIIRKSSPNGVPCQKIGMRTFLQTDDAGLQDTNAMGGLCQSVFVQPEPFGIPANQFQLIGIQHFFFVQEMKRELADEILSGEGIGQALISREEVLELLGR